MCLESSMTYSFDNGHIGLIKKGGSSLTVRLIPRPERLALQSWFELAGAVVRELNKQETLWPR